MTELKKAPWETLRAHRSATWDLPKTEITDQARMRFRSLLNIVLGGMRQMYPWNKHR